LEGFFWSAAYIAVFAGGFWAFDAVAREAASLKDDVFSEGAHGIIDGCLVYKIRGR
jgi:hypothetical protein